MSSIENIVHLFFQHPLFIENKTTLTTQAYQDGGPGILSKKNYSYFNKMLYINDQRKGDRILGGVQTSEQGSLLLDEAVGYNKYFSDLYAIQSTADRGFLFKLIERVIFGYTTIIDQPNLDAELITTYSRYVGGSIELSKELINTSIYSTSTSASLITFSFIQFKWRMVDSENNTKLVDIKVWLDDLFFQKYYPLSFITAVIPPLSYETLYSESFLDASSNVFTVANTTASISQGILDPKIRDLDNTGVLLQKVKAFDSLGNSILITFQIVYKGALPDTASIRQALTQSITSSGVGNLDGWKKRIPEIYISDQFYLIPHWNYVTERPDDIIYPGIINIKKIQANIREILDYLDPDYINLYQEVLFASYNEISISTIPHELNLKQLSLYAVHPTYQALTTTDVNYAHMTVNTRRFTVALNEALAIAAGNISSTSYAIRKEHNLTFVTFSLEGIEYCLLTKESFLNKI